MDYLTTTDMEKQILAGSCRFFDAIEGFTPKDRDYIRLQKTGNGYNYIRQISTGRTCYFDVVVRPKEEMIAYALSGNGPAMQAGKFLVPEFADYIGLTIEDLRRLQPLVDSLDGRHAYEKIIYDAYLTNGSFTLTDDQLAQAYESYRKARQTVTESEQTEETENGSEQSKEAGSDGDSNESEPETNV